VTALVTAIGQGFGFLSFYIFFFLNHLIKERREEESIRHKITVVTAKNAYRGTRERFQSRDASLLTGEQ
jgi:hypothetical protein